MSNLGPLGWNWPKNEPGQLIGWSSDGKYIRNYPALVVASARTVNPIEPRFGAIGDGVADDTAAIQAAMDYLSDEGGGTLLINHHHRVTNTLLYTNDAAKIIFYSPSEGLGSITYVGTADIPVLKFTYGDYLGDASNPPWVIGLGIYRNSSVAGGRAIECTYANRIGQGRGIGFRVADCVIDAVTGDGYFHYGVFADYCIGARFENNFIKGRGGLLAEKTGNGIYLGTWAQGSNILKNRVQGFDIGINVSDDYFTGTPEEYESEGVEIFGNKVQNCNISLKTSANIKEASFKVINNTLNGGRIGYYSRNLVGLIVEQNTFQHSVRNADRCDIMLEGDNGTEGNFNTQAYSAVIGSNRSLGQGNLKLSVTGVTRGAETVIQYTTAESPRALTAPGIYVDGDVVKAKYSGTDPFEEGDEVTILGITSGPTALNGETFTAGEIDTGANTVVLVGLSPDDITTPWVSGGTIGFPNDTGAIANGNVILIHSMRGSVEGNYIPFVVSDLNTGAGTFKIKDYYDHVVGVSTYVDSSAWTAWQADGIIQRYARHIEVRGGSRIQIGAASLRFRHVGVHLWEQTKDITVSPQFAVQPFGRPSAGILTINNSLNSDTIDFMPKRYAEVYRTRAAFVAAVEDGQLRPDGDITVADGLAYKWESGATAISDLPGLVPAGVPEQGHWGSGAITNDPVGFWPDVETSNIWRVNGRIFIGDAAKASGKTGGLQTQDTWPTDAADGANWLLRDGALVSISHNGTMGVVGMARASDQPAPQDRAAIGVAGYAEADVAAKAAWAGYFEGEKKGAGNGAVYGVEIVAKNGTTQNYNPTPYNRNNWGPVAVWLNTGDDRYGEVPTTPSGAAVMIGTGEGGVKFNKGIIFNSDGIEGTDGSTGTGVAIHAARGHEFVWNTPSPEDLRGAFIRSEVNANNSRVGMLFDDLVVQFIGLTGAMGSFENGAGAGVAPSQYVRHMAGASNSEIRAGGSGTDAEIWITTKGAGINRLRDSAGNDRVSWNSTGIGFHGTAPVAKPTVTGARRGIPAVADLLAELANVGLITNNSDNNAGNAPGSFATRADLVSAVAGGLLETNGQIIYADGIAYKWQSGATDIADLPGLVHVAPQRPAYIPSRRYPLAVGVGAASAAVVPAVDTIYFLPFMVHNVLPLKQLSIFVTTGGAGSSCKAAIWANYNGVNQPLGAPLFVNNTGVATATSTTTVDINVTDGVLDPYTLYWFGAKWTGTLPQIWQYANLTFATAALVGIQGAFNNTTNISFADAYANDMPTFTTASSFVQHGNGAPTVFAVT